MAGLLVLLAVGQASAEEPKKDKARTIEISVTENGFEPTPIKLKKDEPVTLVVTRKTDSTCARKLVLDEGKIAAELPLNKPVEIAFTPKKTGQIKYGCAMGKMVSGVLLVE